MRYGIFSDIHSNLEAWEAAITAYQSENIDRYLCLGDVVGYAANPKECVAAVAALAAVTVAGNHDWASVDLFSLDYFNPLAREAICWTKRNLGGREKSFLESLRLTYKNEDLTLVHGTLDNPEDFNYLSDDFSAKGTFRLLENNLCFVGHTHVSGIFVQDKDGRIYYQDDAGIRIKEDNKYIINVGSVGQPRDGNPQACYCIYDSAKKEAEIKRIGYDIEAAARKIVNAGLPRFLAERLLSGS
ncbi:MAG: metallophosphoesterase family protein [Candidatus Omnitrophota bacterium]|jgi:predicted phosphodiesterase